jgi:ABC-type Fe3+-siderophore transport system permease subunit
LLYTLARAFKVASEYGGMFMRYKILLLALLGLVVWLIETIAGNDVLAQALGADVSELELMMGIIVATIGAQFYA